MRDGARLELSAMVARLDPATEGLEELLESLGIPYLFEFRGRTGFDRVLRFDADLPPIDHVENGDRVQSSGVLIDGSLDGRRLVSRGRLESLAIESGPWRFDVLGLATDGDNVTGS
jgi:hypothetical protein